MVIKVDSTEGVKSSALLELAANMMGLGDFMTLDAIPEDLNSTISNLTLWVRALPLIKMQIPLGPENALSYYHSLPSYD